MSAWVNGVRMAATVDLSSVTGSLDPGASPSINFLQVSAIFAKYFDMYGEEEEQVQAAAG